VRDDLAYHREATSQPRRERQPFRKWG